MSAVSESKRRKAKKKRSAQQTKENQVPKAAASSGKTGSNGLGLDASIPLSQVVNKSSFTPFLDGERCILCHQERPTLTRKADKSNAGADILPGTQQFVDKLPLWVCPECRKRVEEDEQKAGLDSALHAINNDKLLQSSEGVINSFVPEEGPNKDLCNCHVCAGKRHLVPGKTKEVGELQFSWFEVKHFVRCVYRKAGTTLADDDKLTKTSLDVDRMKRHTEKLTSRDACQLFERLEAQTREYLTEVRVSLIKFFSSTFSNSPQHAKDCVMTLLDEYQSLSVATEILKPFFQKLDSNYLKNFKWSWELMNKELFSQEIFNDSVIRNNLPQLFQQFRAGMSISSCGVPVPDKCAKDSIGDLIERFEAFTWIMTETDSLWAAVRPLREKYNKEKKLHERSEHENWDEPLKNTEQDKVQEICGCEQCDFLSSHLTSTDDVSSSLLSLKRSLSSSSSSSSSRSPTQYCSRHAQDGSTDGDELSNMSSTQLLPTALFLNRLTNSKCATCIREALHSFCFDQKTFLQNVDKCRTKCKHHEEHDEELPSNKLAGLPDLFDECDSSPDPPHPFWYNHDTAPPETASSIQSLILNGHSPEKICQSEYCKNLACAAQWEDMINRAREDGGCQGHGGCHGHEGCHAHEDWHGHNHRASISSSIMIPGNDDDVEAPPSSPSSDRSVGDGSSCDTPTSRSSLSEDGRSSNGKYCDCCYCEFFGHGTPSVAQTSHNFVEIREKLRLRLKEKGKKTVDDDLDYHTGLNCITDTRSVDELLTFINGDQAAAQRLEMKANLKTAKRQRQKQKKAAEKVIAVSETNGSCLYNRDQTNEMDERPPLSEEKPKKNTRQKRSSKVKSQENLAETLRENAKNHEKTLKNDVKHHASAKRRGSAHETGGNMLTEKPAPVKQGAENGNHVDKRKKGREKKTATNKSEGNGQERRVIVNGSGQESATYVEHTCGARLPVREEAEPKHCGEEVPAQVTQTQIENQGKKIKNRRKKKGAYLDDVFLPKENLTNGHNVVVDEAEREVEEFKRFCASVAPVTRKLKLPANVNLKNLNLGSKKS